MANLTTEKKSLESDLGTLKVDSDGLGKELEIWKRRYQGIIDQMNNFGPEVVQELRFV